MAAAHVVKRYTAQAPDELSFEVRLGRQGPFPRSPLLLPPLKPFPPLPGGRHRLSDRHAAHRGSELVAGQAGLPGEPGLVSMRGRALCPLRHYAQLLTVVLLQVGFFPSECVELFTERPGPGLKAGKYGGGWVPSHSLPTTCSFYHCAPTDADSPLCGIPAPQGISSLTSGNGNTRSGLCPAPPGQWHSCV